MSDIKAFLFDDDRGVSPVIGVILMVAITVILAAVIAAFVLGLGDTNSTAPNVNFEYDYSSDDELVQVTMTGGESFDPERVEFQVDGSGNVDTSPFPVGADESGSGIDSNEMNDNDPVNAGDSITIDLNDAGNTGDNTDDFELDIIFTSEDGGTSSTIGGTTGPDA